jgi:hypothetical protein
MSRRLHKESDHYRTKHLPKKVSGVCRISMEKPNCMRKLRGQSYRKDRLEVLLVLNRAPAHVRAGEQRRDPLRHGLQRRHHVVEGFRVVQEVEPVQIIRGRGKGHGGATPEHHDIVVTEPALFPVCLTLAVVASLHRRHPQSVGVDTSSVLMLPGEEPHHHHEMAEVVEEVAADNAPRISVRLVAREAVGHQAHRERAVRAEPVGGVDQDLLGVGEHVEAFQAMTREVNHVVDPTARQHVVP